MIDRTTKGYPKFVMPVSVAQQMVAQGLLDDDQIIISDPLPDMPSAEPSPKGELSP